VTPMQILQGSGGELNDSANDVFLDLGRPKEVRRFELGAAAQLANINHLQQALNPNRPQRAPGGATTMVHMDLTPLEAACQAGLQANVKLLLKDLQEKELSVDSSKASGFRSMKPRPNLALLLAVDSGAADTVRLLLEGNMSPNAPCAGKRPPLLSAIRDGHLDIVQVLCESSEVDVDAQDARGRSALHECVWRGDMAMLNILLGKRANPVVADARGWAPAHLAAHLGNMAMLRQLLLAKAPIDGETTPQAADGRNSITPGGARQGGSQAEPPLQPGSVHSNAGNPASRAGSQQSRALTAASGAPSSGWAPLHLVLSRGDLDAVSQLISWGADACRPGGPDGQTPLMLAISSGQEEIALRLLALTPVRERVDAQDRRGRCALHFAVKAVSTALVSSLIEANACPSLPNESGLSPIDMARSSGIPDTSEVVKHMNVEEIVRLVILRTKYRAQNKYEESEMIRSDLRLRGVSLDIQSERWSLPDGTWGFLSVERSRAEAQAGPASTTTHPKPS